MESFSAREESISADLSRLRSARAFAEMAAVEFGLTGEGAYRAKLAMSEVVANAVEHGSEGPQDRIDLTAAEEDGALAFYVKDSGRFVPRVAVRGTMPERGRGLDFVRAVMDEVDIRPGSEGTVARLVIRAPAAT